MAFGGLRCLLHGWSQTQREIPAMRWTQAELDEYRAKFHRPVNEWDEPDQGKESVLQGKIEAWCREHGYPCQSNRQTSKARGLLTPGWPDICAILPQGRVLFIECKSAKGVMRDDQKHLRQRFLFLGHEYHQVRSFRRFMELIYEYRKEVL